MHGHATNFRNSEVAQNGASPYARARPTPHAPRSLSIRGRFDLRRSLPMHGHATNFRNSEVAQNGASPYARARPTPHAPRSLSIRGRFDLRRSPTGPLSAWPPVPSPRAPGLPMHGHAPRPTRRARYRYGGGSICGARQPARYPRGLPSPLPAHRVPHTIRISDGIAGNPSPRAPGTPSRARIAATFPQQATRLQVNTRTGKTTPTTKKEGVHVIFPSPRAPGTPSRARIAATFPQQATRLQVNTRTGKTTPTTKKEGVHVIFVTSLEHMRFLPYKHPRAEKRARARMCVRACYPAVARRGVWSASPPPAPSLATCAHWGTRYAHELEIVARHVVRSLACRFAWRWREP